METAQEKQESEIIALKSIYAEDFIECQPRAWKGAARLKEFKIRVSHPEQPDNVHFHLHTIFPKTYPHNAHPTFSVQQPAKGLTQDQLNRLSQSIHAQVKQFAGDEMVFQIATFAQEWLSDNATPSIESGGSLAMQMTRRAQDEERVRREKEQAEADEAAERAHRLAEEMQAEVNTVRQQQEKEKLRQRHRAKSDAAESEFPASPEDIFTESFDEPVVVNGIRFNTVKLFHPKPASTDRACFPHLIKMKNLGGDIPPLDPLGTIYKADPICDDVTLTLPLEVHALTFESAYYHSSMGKKKLMHLESELRRLCQVKHRNVCRVYAVKLLFPVSAPPRLSVLMEERPSLTLFELLEDSGTLRPERAKDYTDQTLRGLAALHNHRIVHRGIALHTVGLDYDSQSASKRVKLMNCSYYVTLLDLHRSNPFGPHMYTSIGELYRLPDGWRSKDAMESNLHYTEMRDLHAVGVNLMQMLHGMNVTNEYANVNASLERSARMTPLLTQYVQVLCFSKKSIRAGDALSALQAIGTSSPALNSKGPSSPVPIPVDPKTPRQSDWGSDSSPELDYFPHEQARDAVSPTPTKVNVSRYKQDYMELELLGRGAFGSVVKALNTFDGGIYAVKKVKLRDQDWGKENKIFREVAALSRLSHRYIVRYHSTWIETSEPASAAASDDDSDGSDETEIEDTADGRMRGAIMRRKASKDRRGANGHSEEGSDPFAINFDSLTTTTTSSDTARSDGRTFPTIHFSHSGSKPAEDSDGDLSSSDEMDDIVIPQIQRDSSQIPQELALHRRAPPPRPPAPVRTLYIQMEFVERQTLKERIDEGISDDEAWRLFRQIVEALMHMASLNILHRDIKLTNIFIDSQGNCKVGDFGLATSSLQAVEKEYDPSSWAGTRTPEMTLDVGTRLYIAPEVQMPVSKKKDKEKKPRNHSKADMYSLGIVFFEMNYQFKTGAERIRVIEDLRKPTVIFPQDWDPKRKRQREIINWLLQHDPDQRPTALELSQSNLMPFTLEEEYYMGALRMMTQPDSTHYQATINALFDQRASLARSMLYDENTDQAEYKALTGIVRDTLAAMFRLHGAIEMEPPALIPLIEGEDEENRAVFLDRHGEIVALPNNPLIPFARLAARTHLQRIKRFHIGDIYRPNAVVGHPRVAKAAILDLITNDVANGASISTAETIIIANECLDAFPSLAQHYEIHISHSSIVELCLNRMTPEHRATVADVLQQTKSTWAQKRATLLKKSFLRTTVDELEILDDHDDDMDAILSRLERIAPTFREAIKPYIADIKQVIQFASLTVARPIYFHPLMLGTHTSYFKDGVCFEVVRRNKRTDVLGAGGRYDNLIARYCAPKAKGMEGSPICSVGIQLSLEKILAALAAYQAAHVKTFVKDQRSFGFWSPRRCDVYVVSYTQGHLSERLEVASLLWRHGISCDIMYESALESGTQEDFVELCNREGILFFLWPRPRSPRRDQSLFKIRSILKGTEFEVSRQELVPWLQQQIAEQKRVDTTTSGAPVLTETSQGPVVSKDPSNNTDVQLLLPGESKKTWKQKKQMFLDKAFDHAIQIQSAAQSGIPVVAVDVGPATFELLGKSAAWLADDDAWKAIVASFLIPNPSYANQIRDTVNRRRLDGHRFIILFAVREERSHLLTLVS